MAHFLFWKLEFLFQVLPMIIHLGTLETNCGKILLPSWIFNILVTCSKQENYFPMEEKDPKNSVRKEQFSDRAENLKKETQESLKGESSEEIENQEGRSPEREGSDEERSMEDEQHTHDQSSESLPDENKKDKPGPVTEDDDSGSVESGGKAEGEPHSDEENLAESDAKESVAPENSGTAEDKHPSEESTGDSLNEQQKERTEEKKQETDEREDKKAAKLAEQKGEIEEDASKQGEEQKERIKQQAEKKREIINYALLKKPDLIELLKELLNEGRINEIGPDVAAIKSSFYKQYKAEIEDRKQTFLKQGGNEQDFSPGISEEEETFKELLKKYNDLRSEYNKHREEEKDENLRKKHAIIDEIKELVHRDESINKTFQEFRDLQRRWHEIGIVPQGELKDLWETYHYHVEKFYDYIKINKELRDLDLKKNLEAKLELCEKAEELLLEPNIVNAFKTLQKYHDQWREIGPVPKENRSEIWERFREATSKINKKHQQYYQDLKDSQKKNLESKTLLSEKAESIADLDLGEHEEWVDKTREILEIQKVWKTIGFAPKKDNNRIYARFRAACDKFFDKKREFYAQGMEHQQENLQKKLDLCVQAEALQDSTDWKKTTDELIALQKKWKKIGPVPRKKSDAVWKRFRAACDKFFNRKSDFFSNIEETYEKNLENKEKLIKEINEFKPGDSLKDNLSALNEFQRRWSAIGFVPYEKKDEIMQHYRDSINEKYDELQMDEHKRNVLKFQNKLDAIKNKPRPENKLRFERDKLMNRLQQLKSDIVVWENNIGFFTESKKADSMVRDFEQKIESARKKIKLMEDKISMIDDLDEQL
jgi:hypothetical protein